VFTCVLTLNFFFPVVILILFTFCGRIETECEFLCGKCVPELVGFSKDICHRTLLKSDNELCDGFVKYCILGWTEKFNARVRQFS